MWRTECVGTGGYKWQEPTTLPTCSASKGNNNHTHTKKTSQYLVAKTHLEKVILVHNTTVGQHLDQLICQGCFATISDSVNKTKTNA